MSASRLNSIEAEREHVRENFLISRHAHHNLSLLPT